MVFLTSSLICAGVPRGRRFCSSIPPQKTSSFPQVFFNRAGSIQPAGAQTPEQAFVSWLRGYEPESRPCAERASGQLLRGLDQAEPLRVADQGWRVDPARKALPGQIGNGAREGRGRHGV